MADPQTLLMAINRKHARVNLALRLKELRSQGSEEADEEARQIEVMMEKKEVET